MPLSLSMSALSMAQHPSLSQELDIDSAPVGHHHHPAYHSSSGSARHAFGQQQPRLPFSSPLFSVELPSAFDDPPLFSPLTSPTAFRSFGEAECGYPGYGSGYPDIVVQPAELDTASSHSSSPISPSPSSMSYPTPSKSPVSAALSSSSSSASSYTPSPPSSPRKRQRLSTKDRGALRAAASALDIKVKHREIDAQRRQREAAMIQRLDALTADKMQQEEEEEEKEAASGGRQPQLGGRKRKKEKVQILQDTVSRLEQLQEVVKELSAQCRQQEAVIQYMTPQHKAATTLLPRLTFYDDAAGAAAASSQLAATSSSDPSTALSSQEVDRVSHVLSHPSMLSALFVSGSCCAMLLDTATGNMVDANAQFLAMVGWDRRDVIGCLVTAPFDVIVQWSSAAAQRQAASCPFSWKDRYGRNGAQRPLVQQTVVNAAGQQGAEAAAREAAGAVRQVDAAAARDVPRAARVPARRLPLSPVRRRHLRARHDGLGGQERLGGRGGRQEVEEAAAAHVPVRSRPGRGGGRVLRAAVQPSSHRRRPRRRPRCPLPASRTGNRGSRLCSAAVCV